MPLNYLSRLLASETDPIIAAFDPFQPGLGDLQKDEDFARNIWHWGQTNQWPNHLSKKDANSHANLLKKMFHNKDSILWVRLDDHKYPRTALILPKKYQKEAICKAHNSIFGRHDATLKTYIKITSSYYWLGMY